MNAERTLKGGRHKALPVRKLKRRLIALFAATTLLGGVAVQATTVAADAASKTKRDAPGNNGTLKIHEEGTPSGTESNDPKVCRFNVEGFNFDTGQTGYLMFDVQGGDQPTGTPAGPFTWGPADANGFYATQYFDLDPGHYKATLYGKMTPKGKLKDIKAKSKVFKVICEEEEPPPPPPSDCKCPPGTVWVDKDHDGKFDKDECVKPEGTSDYTFDCKSITVYAPKGLKPEGAEYRYLLDGVVVTTLGVPMATTPGNHSLVLEVKTWDGSWTKLDEDTLVIPVCPTPPPPPTPPTPVPPYTCPPGTAWTDTDHDGVMEPSECVETSSTPPQVRKFKAVLKSNCLTARLGEFSVFVKNHKVSTVPISVKIKVNGKVDQRKLLRPGKSYGATAIVKVGTRVKLYVDGKVVRKTRVPDNCGHSTPNPGGLKTQASAGG